MFLFHFRQLYSRLFDGLKGSVSALVGANVAAQALTIAFVPILTRLYGPADFGVLTTYMALTSILSIAIAFRYDVAIPLASEEREALNLAALASFVVLTLSLIMGFGLFLWGKMPLSSTGPLEPYLWLLPMGLFLSGLQQIFVFWVSFMRRFQLLATNRILQSLLQGLLQVGLSPFGALGLLLGFVLSRLVGVVSLLRDLLIKREAWSPASWYQLARKYKSFPLLNMPAALLDAIGLQLVPLMFARLFPVEVAGFYGLAFRVVAFPSALLGQAVAQVFYPEASRRKDQEAALKMLVVSTSTVLLYLSGPVFGWLYLCSPIVFSWVFGKEWTEAGVYASYLSLWLFFNFISSPLSTVPLVKGQQRKAFYFTVYEVVFRLLAVWLGGYFQNPQISILSYSLVGSAISLVYLIWIFRLVGGSFWGWIRSNALWFLVVVFFLTSSAALRSAVGDGVFLSAATVGMGLLALVGLRMWRLRNA